MNKKQNTINQLRKLTHKHQKILMLEENCLLVFKRYFMYITQKCLKLLAITRNRKLVELFVRSLNTTFQDTLNL